MDFKRKIKKHEAQISDFGLWFVLKYYYTVKTKNYDSHIRMVYDYLSKELENLVREYQTIVEYPREEKPKTIWVCWWQGYDAMPELCRLCVDRLQTILPKEYTLIFLSKENYSQYVKLPPIILERLESGLLPVPQFCDVMRNALIYQNGGTWIDASVWTNESLFDCLEQGLPYWSVKLHGVYNPNSVGQRISECKWASFILSGEKGSLLSKFVYEGMCQYYSRHCSTIEYFTQNVIIRIAYDQIPMIHDMIETIPESNRHMYDLFEYMSSPFDPVIWEELNADTGVFKLTQKRQYTEEIGGKETFYTKLKTESKNYV